MRRRRPAPMPSGSGLARRLRRRPARSSPRSNPVIISIAVRRGAPADCGRDWRDTCGRKNGPTGILISSPLGRACSAPLSRNRATNAPSTPRSAPYRSPCQSRSPASAVRIAAAAPRICDSGRKARRFLPTGKMLGRRPTSPSRGRSRGVAAREGVDSPIARAHPTPRLRRDPPPRGEGGARIGTGLDVKRRKQNQS
jgi:hypothetical protein